MADCSWLKQRVSLRENASKFEIKREMLNRGRAIATMSSFKQKKKEKLKRGVKDSKRRKKRQLKGDNKPTVIKRGPAWHRAVIDLPRASHVQAECSSHPGPLPSPGSWGWMCPWALGSEIEEPMATPWTFDTSVDLYGISFSAMLGISHRVMKAVGNKGSHKNGWRVKATAQTCGHIDADGRWWVAMGLGVGRSRWHHVSTMAPQ